MSLAESIANNLGGKKSTPEGYLCRCPCHEDKTSSLSLADTDAGLLVNCFAGCEWKVIKAELERRGLLPSSKAPAKRKGENKYYVYKDIAGNTLCRKVKTPEKKMWFERLDGNIWRPGLAGMVVPLYNLRDVLSASVVYLCEGEKDAETLIAAGHCGTTNHAGAGSWAPHLSDSLKSKTVVIIPDNDEPGRKRIRIVSKALQGLVKELRVFIPDGVPDHGDITDWVEAGGDVGTILARSTVIEKRKESKHAPIDDYFELFESTWDHPRKCMFSEKLMRWSTDGEFWTPCINSIGLIKSAALVLNETRESKFSMDAIEHHFLAFEASKQPELLVDIPTWDGQERIAGMASLMQLRSEAGITDDAWIELLKEWCALCFERLHNPKVQNRILILQGPQGIGKDTWTDMLVDGLGQFCVPLNVVAGDKDTFLSLHDGLVMKISEYDKTSKTEVSTLKDMITTPKTMLRGAYERERRLRHSRCSFISSANVKDLLRDHTGSRRYMIIEIESITYAYDGWDDERVKVWQMQCLAEMQHLASIKYRASADSWRQMREYLDGKTPTDLARDAIELFSQRLRKDNAMAFGNDEIRIAPNDERAVTVVGTISKELGIKFSTVKNMLNSELMQRVRIGNDRPRVWVIPALDIAMEPGQEDLPF